MPFLNYKKIILSLLLIALVFSFVAPVALAQDQAAPDQPGGAADSEGATASGDGGNPPQRNPSGSGVGDDQGAGVVSLGSRFAEFNFEFKECGGNPLENIACNFWIALKGFLLDVLLLIGRFFAFVLEGGTALVLMAMSVGYDVLNLPIASKGFQITLSIANLGFVVAIILAAFGTMLRIKGYAIKDILKNLIIAALLVNFSFLIVGAILDVSNVASLAMTTDISSHKIADSLDPQSLIIAFGAEEYQTNAIENAVRAGHYKQYKTVSDDEDDSILEDAVETGLDIVNFATLGLNPLTKLASDYLENENENTKRDVFVITDDSEGSDLYQKIIIGLIFTVISTAILAFTLLTVGLMLMVRNMWIVMLVVLMPLAWAAYVLPSFRKEFSKWWKNFLEWAFYLPIVAFFLLLGVNTLEAVRALGFVPRNATSTPLSSEVISIIFQLSVIVLFFLGALKAGRSISKTGTAMAIGLVGFGLGRARFGGRLAGRTTKAAGEGIKTLGKKAPGGKLTTGIGALLGGTLKLAGSTGEKAVSGTSSALGAGFGAKPSEGGAWGKVEKATIAGLDRTQEAFAGKRPFPFVGKDAKQRKITKIFNDEFKDKEADELLALQKQASKWSPEKQAAYALALQKKKETWGQITDAGLMRSLAANARKFGMNTTASNLEKEFGKNNPVFSALAKAGDDLRKAKVEGDKTKIATAETNLEKMQSMFDEFAKAQKTKTPIDYDALDKDARAYFENHLQKLNADTLSEVSIAALEKQSEGLADAFLKQVIKVKGAVNKLASKSTVDQEAVQERLRTILDRDYASRFTDIAVKDTHEFLTEDTKTIHDYIRMAIKGLDPVADKVKIKELSEMRDIATAFSRLEQTVGNP